MLLAGCTGDEGQQGPVGPPGPSGAIKLLIIAADSDQDIFESIKLAYAEALFPLGTVINFINLTDSVPPAAVMAKYDAVLAYTFGVPLDPDAVGNQLADYVDLGGGVVIGQAAYSPPGLGGIGGRIMTEGYSPLRPAPISLNLNNRCIDPNSLSFPLHPIFNGTDVDNICYLGQGDLSDPTLDPTATLLAMDTESPPVPAIAINAKGNVIGTNIPTDFDFNPIFFLEAYKLTANACVFVARGF